MRRLRHEDERRRAKVPRRYPNFVQASTASLVVRWDSEKDVYDLHDVLNAAFDCRTKPGMEADSRYAEKMLASVRDQLPSTLKRIKWSDCAPSNSGIGRLAGSAKDCAHIVSILAGDKATLRNAVQAHIVGGWLAELASGALPDVLPEANTSLRGLENQYEV